MVSISGSSEKSVGKIGKNSPQGHGGEEAFIMIEDELTDATLRSSFATKMRQIIGAAIEVHKNRGGACYTKRFMRRACVRHCD